MLLNFFKKLFNVLRYTFLCLCVCIYVCIFVSYFGRRDGFCCFVSICSVCLIFYLVLTFMHMYVAFATFLLLC